MRELRKQEQEKAKSDGGEKHAANVRALAEAEKKLEGDQEKIGVAEEFNEVLADFSGLSEQDLRGIEKTGLDNEGKKIQTRGGHALDEKVSKHLAGLTRKGVSKLTWGMVNTLYDVADALLKEFWSTLKRVVGLERR